MTFSVTKSTSNADLAGLDNGAAISRGTGKEIGLNGQVQDADAPAEGAFAKLFSALSGAFGSETEAKSNAAESVAEGETASAGDDIAGKTEPNSENNDELLSRLAQSSQFLRADNQTPNSDLVNAPAAEPKTGGNILPNTDPLAPQIPGSAIVGGEPADISVNTDTSVNTDPAAALNTVAGAGTGATSDKSVTSVPGKNIQAGQIQSPQLSSPQANIDTMAEVLPTEALAAATEFADTEQSSTEPSDPVAIIAAAGLPVSGQPAADNTGRNERLIDTAEEKIGANADPVSLAQSGPGTARQAQTADLQLSSAGTNGVSSAQPDTEQSELQDSTTLTDAQDFSAVLDHARGHEQTDPLSRTAKAPILTAAEQQVLDKRVNLHDSRASSELNEKIAVMVNKDIQTATIRLDPAELGSMQIKLVIQNDQANVVIHTQNHHSRDLLDQSMPRLREMLQQQGIALGDSQVQADSGRQQQSNYPQPSYVTEQKNSNNTANAVFDSHSESPVTTQYWQDSAKGVDFYA